MLKDLVPQSSTVTFGDHSFTVRGLTLDDMAALVVNHAEELKALFEGKMSLDQLALKSPTLASKLIAYACDEPDQVPAARRLPLSVQVAALSTIWGLTVFDEEAFVKQVRGLVFGIARFVALAGVPELPAEKARPTFKIGPGREVSQLP